MRFTYGYGQYDDFVALKLLIYHNYIIVRIMQIMIVVFVCVCMSCIHSGNLA